MMALALTNVRTVRMWGRGIAQLKWKHSSGTSSTVRAPWVPEEWDPACSDGEENRDINTEWFWKVVTSLCTLLALDSRSTVSRTSSVMMCGWSSLLTIKVRYLARYSSCRAVEQRPPAKQYRARWVCARECITGDTRWIHWDISCLWINGTHVVLYGLRMVYSVQALTAHYSFLLVGQSLGDMGGFKNQKSVRILRFTDLVWHQVKNCQRATQHWTLGGSHIISMNPHAIIMHKHE